MALVINCLNFKFHNVRFEQFVVRKAKEYSVYNLIGKDSKVDFMLLRLTLLRIGFKFHQEKFRFS